jgi:GT2 family glycosyltransferase
MNRQAKLLKASIVIPTRDRIDELRQLLRSTLAQTVQVEILVMDDGTSEATAQMIRNEFSQVRYHHLGSGCGPAFQRNRGIELASNNFVFPVDDDVLFSSPRTIEQTLAEFGHARVGAVSIPFIDIRHGQMVRQRAPDAKRIYVTHAFVGAAHAVQRDVFLELGGYREHFFYMGEEGDYCLRMLETGYVTRLGYADPIYHHESPSRSSDRMDFYGRRNDILFAWHNVPMPYLPIHLAATTLNGFAHAATRAKHPFRMLSGIINGYRDCARRWSERRPVRASVYRLHRQLKKRGPLPLLAMERGLPALSIEVSGSAGGAHVFSKT